MNLLAIDTCGKLFSIAIALDSGIQFEYSSVKENIHVEEIILSIESSLKRCSIDYKDLNAIAITRGPGSFTGIKIGIACVQGISMVLDNIDVFGISTLEVMAANYYENNDGDISVALSAGKEKVYYQEFTTRDLINQTDLTNQTLKQYNAVSDIMLKSRNDISHDVKFITEDDYKHDARGIVKAIISNKELIRDITPIYLREPYV